MVTVGCLMMRMMRATFFHGPPSLQPARRTAEDNRALSTLRLRYARGEIELEEYERWAGPLLHHEPRSKLT